MGVWVEYFLLVIFSKQSMINLNQWNFLEINSYLSYQMSLTLLVVGIEGTTFSVVISAHGVSQLMGEGEVSIGTTL